MIRKRLWVEASWSSTGRSMTSLMRSSFLRSCGEREPRKCFKRIVGTHARYDACRQMRRYRVIAVELPMWVIGGEQEHLVRVDHVDDVCNAFRIGRTVERLRGQADVVAHDRRRLAIDPGHLDADAAPGLVGAPHEGRQPADAGLHQHDLEAG